MKSKKICPLATRIKKMMQTDDDVGKISQATPILIGRAMELFLEKLCKQAIGVAQSRQAKTLTPGHLKAAVTADANLDFLAELVASAPDLPPPDAEGADGGQKPVKRRKTNDMGEGLASPQGGARSKAADAAAGDAPAPKPRGRAAKPPVPPAAGGSGPPSRTTSGNVAGPPGSEQPPPGTGPTPSGRGRGGGRPKKAAAAAATAAPGSAAETAGLPISLQAVPLLGAGFCASAPDPSPLTSPVELGLCAAASMAARPLTTAGSTAPPSASKPATSTGMPTGAAVASTSGGSGAGGAGGSVIASLRAQQPFFGLGRRGKNIGPKAGGGGATPAASTSLQQQGVQGLLPDAGAAALGAAGLKLEPLDLSRPGLPFAGLSPLALEALQRGDMPMAVVSAAAEAAALGLQHPSLKVEGGDAGTMFSPSLSPFHMQQQEAPGAGSAAALPGSEQGLASACGAALGSAPPAAPEQPHPQLSFASSCQLPQIAAATGNGGVTLGAPTADPLLPQLGSSLALFQSTGDMDDDYDNC